MTNQEYEISSEPPRDDDGHPIHPERGHRICGATKSDRTTPTEHGRERDEYDYCLLAAGWGTDRQEGPCSKHPVTGEQWGKSNPNYKHGAFSQYVRSNLSERQEAALDHALDAVDDPEEIKSVLAEIAFDHILQGQKMEEPRLTREGRQLLAEFNIVDAADQVEVSGSIDHVHEHDVPDHVVEAIVGASEANLEGVDNG